MIDEAMIDALVEAFYARVRRDDLLGPVFEAAVGGHWDAHLAKIKDFWSSVMLQTGRFAGSPMRTHLGVPGIAAAHFERWLELFGETAREVCPAVEAEAVAARPRMIGRSLQFGLAAARGELPT